jgi:tetratricopeptide (TPR) repeat protein
MIIAPRFIVALALLYVTGCAATQHPSAPPHREIVNMEELHITAARGDTGYQLQAYDASDLFKRATDLLNQKKCTEAVQLYDQLVREFAQSAYASAALYNAGLCLQAVGDFEGSALRYATLRERYPASEDRKDTSFQLAEVLVQLERWQQTLDVADELLARQDLISAERVEAMARRAQALLGQRRFDEAERYAQGALSFFRTRSPEDRIKDDFFAAACNYVVAETFRQRAQAMEFPQGVEEQKKVLIRRAELLLEAQREYFNTISLNNVDNYHWAAAAGYRIGNMYDELWHAVMTAPVPAQLPPEGYEIYHAELAKLIKPLIRHAIRYWELTEMFIERTGIKTPWADKIRTDLARVRTLLLEQSAAPDSAPTSAPPVKPGELAPPGAEGRPAPPPAQPGSTAQPESPSQPFGGTGTT